MFSAARIKLTLIYSLIFFVMFWSFSVGLYFWMSNYLNGSYITQVQARHMRTNEEIPFNATNVVIATTAGNVALDQLRSVLLDLNLFLLLVIPGVTWGLTGRTLLPVKQMHERETQFVSDASHELKTPLSIMKGEVEVALGKNRPAAEYRQLLGSLREEVARLIELVENLLMLARVDKQNLALINQTVDVGDAVVVAIKQLKPKIDAKQIQVRLDLPEQIPVIQGNATLIHQLAVNLLDNAIKYTPKEGLVNVAVAVSRKKIILKVSDTGIGIPEASRTHIFDRFYRVDGSRSLSKGYGLGLSISDSIVKLHRGTIEVTSKLKHGSTFMVTLPSA